MCLCASQKNMATFSKKLPSLLAVSATTMELFSRVLRQTYCRYVRLILARWASHHPAYASLWSLLTHSSKTAEESLLEKRLEEVCFNRIKNIGVGIVQTLRSDI